MLQAEKIRDLLEYEPETGHLRWKRRPTWMFKADGKNGAELSCASWNTKYAGTIAGSPDARGYRIVIIRPKHYLAHRLAWAVVTGEWPVRELDHINCDPSDNRWVNLREATSSQNKANTEKRSDNTSGLKGVSWSKKDKKFTAQIQKNNKRHRLGYFACPAAAHFAYLIAADKIHGEFARAG